MAYTWEKDADDINRAFAKFNADKAVLIGKNYNSSRIDYLSKLKIIVTCVFWLLFAFLRLVWCFLVLYFYLTGIRWYID